MPSFDSRAGVIARARMCVLCGEREIAWKMTVHRAIPGLGLKRGDVGGYCVPCRPHVELQVSLAERGITAGRVGQ